MIYPASSDRAQAMRKVPEVLLRTFLRRYPLPTRINLFSYLGQYSWLKDVLEELRPELFPPPKEAEKPAIALPQSKRPSALVLGLLERSEVYGRVGRYKAETYLGERGNGHLFGAIDLASKRPVIIKEFLLPAAQFTKTEALHRQSRFQQLAGFQLADGRSQDFRVMQPIEAIADTESQELCFLVTDSRDRSPTLRQYLQEQGPLPLAVGREVLSQILQTLDFLHQQKFSFSTGAVQRGVVHGNLSLDTVLWTGPQSQPFVYLCDLRLWEQCFDPTVPASRSTQVTPDLVQQDLRAVGDIGYALGHGLDRDAEAQVDPGWQQAEDSRPPIEPHLAQILDSLKTGKFDSAETARRQLLQLVPRSPMAIAPLEATEPKAAPKTTAWLVLILSLMALLAGSIVLWPRLRSTATKTAPAPLISTCCLAEVSGIPPGTFTYTAVRGGTWWTVLQQRDLLERGQGMAEVLTRTQPKLQLQFFPTESLEQVLEQVRSGGADFAILPMLDDLPKDMLAQEIAYDGLAAVVVFSYAKRQQGLPTALKGKLTLDQVRQLYEGQIEQWKAIDGPPLPVRRYVSSNPETIEVLERRLLNDRPIDTFPGVQPRPSLDLSRQIIRDFEDKEIGSIGIAPLSEILGQCSVYPLALSRPGQAAVQPLALSNGQPIDPETDLCNRKGAYATNPDRFQNGDYPLSYPIAVVYPRDNRRSAIGKKFAELLRTIEGQRLLRAAGLVPIGQVARQPSPSPGRPGGRGAKG
jgi:hypothetical protein